MKQNLLILNAILQHSAHSKLSAEHHLQGIIYHQFQIENQKNQIQYKKQWIHNTILLEELENMAPHVLALNLSTTLLKGAHLLLDLYPDLGSRFLSDIDILIEEKEYDHWVNLLTASGYKPVDVPTFFGNNFKSQWSKFRGDIEINIELHTKLFFHIKEENWKLVPSSKVPYGQLSLEDTFIHLCGHLALQHTFLKLYWLFDIYFYVKKFGHEINWEEVKIKSKSSHLYQSVVMCLWSIHKYFILDKKIASIFSLNESKWWQNYLTLDFFLFPDTNKLNYFLVKHATKDKITEALWYDLTWIWHYKIQKKLLSR